jgi:ribosomal protein S6E (S10)
LALPQFSQATTVKNEVVAVEEKDKKYTEITADQLPQAVSNAIAKDYVGFKVEKAFKGDDGSFKVKVSQGEDKSVLFYSANGELVKSEKATDKAKSEKAHPEKP